MSKEVVKTARDRVAASLDTGKKRALVDGLPCPVTLSEFNDSRNTGSGSRVKGGAYAVGTPNFKTNKVGK